MSRRAMKCPCGSCHYWHVWPEAALQGVSFTERQAKAVVAYLNKMDEEDAMDVDAAPVRGLGASAGDLTP